MDVQITIRRGTAGDGFRERAEERARRLEKYDPRLLRLELLFDEDAGQVAAEARAVVPGAPVLVARAAEPSRRTALDRVLRKVSRQLRRERARKIQHRVPSHAGVTETHEAEVADPDGIEAEA